MATITDYLDLLPSANVTQPNFLATLTAALQPLVDARSVLELTPEHYDIDSAIGAQLDVIGQWAGLSRKLSVPITDVYFSLDTDGLGLDEGVIFGPGNPIDGITSLDDETYRLLLKIKITSNSWDGTFEKVQDVLSAIADDGSYLFVQDNFDMSMLIGVSGIVPSKLFASLLRSVSAWFRPAAISISQVAVTSASGTPIFGLDINNAYIGGLDSGALAINY